MASLKEIMNDDDLAESPHLLKRAPTCFEPDPRPPHGPETSFPTRPAFSRNTSISPFTTTAAITTTTTTTTPTPPPPLSLPPPKTTTSTAIATSRRRPAIAYPQRARVDTLPTSLPLVASSDFGFRRHSNASAESMDSSYRGHTYLPDRSATQASAMRPGLASNPPSETPVKLTPITKRVSKAKKGMPVHECDICQPPKNFTRAEHLRRHQLSHNPPDLHCNFPGCERLFHREDLLKRHQQRHEQEQVVTQAHPHPPHTAPRDPDSSCMASSYTGMSIPPYVPDTPGPTSRSSGQLSAPWSSRASGHEGTGFPSQEYYLDTTFPSQASMPSLMTSYNQPRTSMMGPIPSLPTPVTPSRGNLWTDARSSNSSNFSTPSDDSRIHHSLASNPAESWPMSLGPVGSSTAVQFGAPLAFPYSTTMELPLSGYGSDDGLYPSRNYGTSTVRSLPPPPPLMAVAQSSETLVTAATPLPTDRLIEPALCQGWQQQQGFRTVDAVPGGGLTSVHLTNAVRQAIPRYVSVFWERVAPAYPIVHRSLLDASEVIPEHRELLECAMAAVATQYLDSPDDRINGSQLHAFAWNRAKIFTKSNPWPILIDKTILLCEFYSRYRGQKRGAHIASPHFARLYQMMYDVNNTFAPIPSEGSLEQRWQAWINMETRRRVLAACFLLDIHSMRYLEQPTTKVRGLDQLSPSTWAIPLSGSSCKLWEAPGAEEWGALLASAQPTQTLSTIPLDNINQQDVAFVSRFDAAIILAALSLRLPRRRSLTKVDLLESPLHNDPAVLRMSNLFPASGSANTYLALHHTPLQILLSVSGDTWIFNNKVPNPETFEDYCQQLQDWRASGSSVLAVMFAARAIKAFLEPCIRCNTIGGEPTLQPKWSSISDYWGFYVCILIFWACGCDDAHVDAPKFSLSAVLQCVSSLSRLQPCQVQSPMGRNHARLMVVLGRRVLAKECLGGRSILIADAVDVLRRLDEKDGRW